MSAHGTTSKKRRYLQGLMISASGNAQAFGYSIVITVSYGIASVPGSSPSMGDLIGFALAAVAAFSLLNIVVAWLARGESDMVGSARALLIATATDFVAVGVAVGVALGIDYALAGLAAWIAIPFGAGLAYVLVQAFELALGRIDADAAQAPEKRR